MKIQHKVLKELQKTNSILRDIKEITYDKLIALNSIKKQIGIILIINVVAIIYFLWRQL